MPHYKDIKKHKVNVGFSTERDVKKWIDVTAKDYKITKSELLTSILKSVIIEFNSGSFKLSFE